MIKAFGFLAFGLSLAAPCSAGSRHVRISPTVSPTPIQLGPCSVHFSGKGKRASIPLPQQALLARALERAYPSACSASAAEGTFLKVVEQDALNEFRVYLLSLYPVVPGTDRVNFRLGSHQAVVLDLKKDAFKLLNFSDVGVLAARFEDLDLDGKKEMVLEASSSNGSSQYEQDIYYDLSHGLELKKLLDLHRTCSYGSAKIVERSTERLVLKVVRSKDSKPERLTVERDPQTGSFGEPFPCRGD